MQEFLKEWGPAVITAVAVLVIVAVIAGLKTNLGNMFETLMKTVQDSSSKVVNDQAGITGGLQQGSENNSEN
mgnify:CR=1 FL=1